MDEPNKKIDEGWKEEAEKEKESLKNEEKFVPPQADFSFFLTTLAIQASIFLGYTENPITNKKEENLDQAKFIIDTLDMLKDKTRGNLSPEEENLLESVLYDLKTQYISKINNKDSQVK
jgi:hypothetical protein